jgi:hypothetical protein
MASPPLVLDFGLLPPGRMTAPRIIGAGYEGGSALSGISLASDVTGGGFLAVDYTDIQLGNADPNRMLFFNRVMQALAGGVRTCVVPFLTDFIAPVAANPFSPVFSPVFGSGLPTAPTLTTFSDGSTFGDGSQFSQAPVAGAITQAASAGGATVSLTVVGGRALQGGEWFGVLHASKSFRAYCVTDVDTQAVDANGNWTATVGIRPTLRDALTVGMVVDWWRPRCLMRIKSGADPTLDLSQFWYATPSLSLTEAF